MTKTPTYNSWSCMKSRCRDVSNPSYYRYGGRGITVCERWMKFENFLSDMGEKPLPHLTIGRIDNSLGYFPENCRWETPQQQIQGRDITLRFRIGNEEKPLSQWCDEYGLPYRPVYKRLKKGWLLSDALSEPISFRSPRKTSKGA